MTIVTLNNEDQVLWLEEADKDATRLEMLFPTSDKQSVSVFFDDVLFNVS